MRFVIMRQLARYDVIRKVDDDGVETFFMVRYVRKEGVVMNPVRSGGERVGMEGGLHWLSHEDITDDMW